VNVRLVPGTCSLSRSPSRIWPSMPVTVDFQRGKPFESVNRFQTISAFARMLTSTPHVIAKVLFVRVNLASFIGQLSGPRRGEQCGRRA
jgi:hypothetical protein